MSKKVKAICLIVVIICIVGYFVWETAGIREYAGEYRSVDATDSTYELTLSKTGRLKVADIGAGNPAIEGFVYRTPFSAKEGSYYLKTGGETDGTFLGLDGNNGKASVWLSVIGHIDDAGNANDFRIITIETDAGHMQFNEPDYFKYEE